MEAEPPGTALLLAATAEEAASNLGSRCKHSQSRQPLTGLSTVVAVHTTTR